MTNAYSVRPLEGQLAYWLRCLSNFASSSFEKRLAPHSVSVAQWMALRTIYEGEGLTLNALAQSVALDKSSLSRMMDRLIERGWVNRGIGSDRRFVNLTLTAQGKQFVEDIDKTADENEKELFKDLSPQEREDFSHVMAKILKSNNWITS